MDSPYIVQRPNQDGTVQTVIFANPSQTILDAVNKLFDELGVKPKS